MHCSGTESGGGQQGGMEGYPTPKIMLWNGVDEHVFFLWVGQGVPHPQNNLAI